MRRQLYDNVSINDTGLGYTYNGGGNRTLSLSHQTNGRFSSSLMLRARTRQDRARSGCTASAAAIAPITTRAPAQVNGLPVAYTFNNGVPTGAHAVRLAASMTVAQLEPGPRHLRAGPVAHDERRDGQRSACASTGCASRCRQTCQAGGPLVRRALLRARSTTCRTGRTSTRVRRGVGSDGQRQDRDQGRHQPLRHRRTTGMANAFEPVERRGRQHHARSWTDTERQLPARLRPAGDRRQRRVRRDGQRQLRPPRVGDHDPIPTGSTGWGKRGYNWQSSLGVDRQLMDGRRR